MMNLNFQAVCNRQWWYGPSSGTCCFTNLTWAQFSLPIFNTFFKSVKNDTFLMFSGTKFYACSSLCVVFLVPSIKSFHIIRMQGLKNFWHCNMFLITWKKHSLLDGVVLYQVYIFFGEMFKIFLMYSFFHDFSKISQNEYL